MPSYPSEQIEPTFLFVFTPPYSGSTALAQVLSTAPRSMMLHPTGEGQALISGLQGRGRWNPGMPVNWASVKAVWMHRVHEVAAASGPVNLVVEKSPPNMVRASGLLKLFPKHQIIVTNRNPYAFCASSLYRNQDIQSQSEEQRAHALKKVAAEWITFSHYVKKIVEVYSPVFFTYEEFCSEAAVTLARTIERIPELNGASANTKVIVKDYPPQRISDQNIRQIALLSDQDRLILRNALRPEEELLRFFGYTSDWSKA